MRNNSKIFVFFASLFLFGCASQAPGRTPTDYQLTAVHCCSNGKVLNGLTARREEETNLFLIGCNNNGNNNKTNSTI